MEKRRPSFQLQGGAIVIAIGLGGCGTLGGAGLDADQQHDLDAYVEAYHFCVAHTASRLDDGQSAIVGISTRALDYCQPEARGVAAYLDSTKLATSTKARYVADLIHTAATRSQIMLRRLRDRESGVGAI